MTSVLTALFLARLNAFSLRFHAEQTALRCQRAESLFESWFYDDIIEKDVTFTLLRIQLPFSTSFLNEERLGSWGQLCLDRSRAWVCRA